MQITVIGSLLTLAEEMEAKHIALGLRYNLEKLINQVLNYLQSGNVWDARFGWDGEDNRLLIHELHMTIVCELLWYRGMIVRYRNGYGDIYCSKTQWVEWEKENPGVYEEMRLYPE